MNGTSARKRLWVVLVLIFGAVAAFDSRLIDGRVAAPTPQEFYGYQTEAFLAGQLYFKVAPDPRLARLSNPYLGSQNRPYRWQDASYYKGRYYSYFGIGPIVLLLLPWRLLTHTYLTGPGAALIFVLASDALAIALLCRWRRVCFPNVGDLALAAACALVTGGNFTTVLLVGSHAGTVAQAAALCCLEAGWWCLLAAATGSAPAGGLAAASACCGLAVACRPSFLPIAAMLLPAAGYLRRRRGVSAGKLFSALLAPIGLIGLGLAGYNEARFDSPFEFGLRYQLTDVDDRGSRLLSVRDLWPRLRDFAGRPFAFGHYFPFIRERADLVPVGLLWVAPASVLSLGLLLCLRSRQPRRAQAALAAAGVGLSFVGLCLFLALYHHFLFHYEVDFIAPWAVLCCLGWFAALAHPWGRAAARPAIAAAGLLLCLGSIAASFCYTAAVSDYHGRFPRLAHWIDGWVDRWDRHEGVIYGPVRLSVRLPAPSSEAWPLLATGYDGGDLVWGRVGAESTLQVGFFHAGEGGPEGDPVPVDPSRPHEVEIRLGSLLPDSPDPFFDRFTPADVRRARSVCRISVDGRVVLSALAPLYPSSPGSVRIGENPGLPDIAAARFPGAILRIERTPFPADWSAVFPTIDTGIATVRFRAPAGRTGAIEPLLSTGIPGRGDVIAVQYLPQGMARFAVDHWGGGARWGTPVRLEPGREHALTIVSDGLAGDRPPKGVIGLVLDRRVVLMEDIAAYSSPPDDVCWGINAVASSLCGGMFGGTILGVAPVSDPDLAILAGPERIDRPGALSFTVRLRTGFQGRPQPLVVSGRAGRADFLYFVVDDARHLHFGLDHWGAGGPSSAPVEFDPGIDHRFVVDLGGIRALGGAGATGADRFSVRLDGKVVFAGRAAFYPTTLATIYVGENPVGGSSTDPRLQGEIKDFAVLP